MLKRLMILILTVISILSSYAQKEDILFDEHKKPSRLFLYDEVPEINFKGTKNFPSQKTRLSEFKGKYIILDFWDKSCSSCIAAFPKMQELQRKFKNDLNIILVTTNAVSELTHLFERSSILKDVKLPMIFSDRIMSEILFPHHSVPFYVWLDKKGKVIAMTDGFSVTFENVQKLIENQPIQVLQRQDILDESISKELMLGRLSLMNINNSFFFPDLLYFSKQLKEYKYSLIMASNKSRNLDVSKINKLFDTSGKQKGIRFLNCNIKELLLFAFFPGGNAYIDKLVADKNLKWESEPSYEEIGKWGEWYWRNNFCYESVLNNFNDSAMKQILISDIKFFFGIEGKVVMQSMPCLILYRTGKKDMLDYAKSNDPPLFENTYSKAGIILKNTSFNQLAGKMRIKNNRAEDPIVIDETGYDPNIKINMVLNIESMRDIRGLSKALGNYGLGIKQEMRVRRILIIKNVQ